MSRNLYVIRSTEGRRHASQHHWTLFLDAEEGGEKAGDYYSAEGGPFPYPYRFAHCPAESRDTELNTVIDKKLVACVPAAKVPLVIDAAKCVKIPTFAYPPAVDYSQSWVTDAAKELKFFGCITWEEWAAWAAWAKSIRGF